MRRAIVFRPCSPQSQSRPPFNTAFIVIGCGLLSLMIAVIILTVEHKSTRPSTAVGGPTLPAPKLASNSGPTALVVGSQQAANTPSAPIREMPQPRSNPLDEVRRKADESFDLIRQKNAQAFAERIARAEYYRQQRALQSSAGQEIQRRNRSLGLEQEQQALLAEQKAAKTKLADAVLEYDGLLVKLWSVRKANLDAVQSGRAAADAIGRPGNFAGTLDYSGMTREQIHLLAQRLTELHDSILSDSLYSRYCQETYFAFPNDFWLYDPFRLYRFIRFDYSVP